MLELLKSLCFAVFSLVNNRFRSSKGLNASFIILHKCGGLADVSCLLISLGFRLFTFQFNSCAAENGEDWLALPVWSSEFDPWPYRSGSCSSIWSFYEQLFSTDLKCSGGFLSLPSFNHHFFLRKGIRETLGTDLNSRKNSFNDPNEEADLINEAQLLLSSCVLLVLFFPG